ncbi:S8 family peptidase [Paraclostridium bifermentans]|uniref:S8 family peptidase n=1 Tax=Paraclostridium bifermentans TaxID=1490 RepID=UPI001C80C55C|nr:S8 family peptidase [Paraclostridium bifermentans]GIM33181.1 hypothetical protein PAGU1678_24500 [Paraclostridium bifermentans subsp. muricolitidis]
MSNLEKEVEYILNKSEILNIPIIIDLKEIESYSNNIDRLKQKYKYTFYLKKELKLKKDEKYYKCELNIKKDVKTLNIDILNSKDISIDIINPGNNCLESLSIDSIKNKFDLGDTTIVISCKDKKNLNIKMISKKSIDIGNWILRLKKSNVKEKNIEIYIKTGTENEIKNVYLEGSYKSLSLVAISKQLKRFYYHRVSEDIDYDKYIPFFYIHFDENIYEDLDKLKGIAKLYKIHDNFGIIYLNKENIDQGLYIYGLKSITSIERHIKMTQLANINLSTENGITATEEIGANYFKTNPNIEISGNKVLICVANSGIDYLHPDFIYPDGTSKIRYLWDQTKDENPPEGFNIGTEYTRVDINKAIQEENKNLSIDEEGIGTALSGICSGLGNMNNQYSGVAENSELIIVKIKKIDGFYSNSMLSAALEYAYEKAKKEKLPLINSITLGSNQSVSSGVSTIENDKFFEYGFCNVVAAGNEGNGNHHATGQMKFEGEVKDIKIEVNDDEEEIEVDLWINKPDKLNVIIVSPTGEESKLSYVSNYSIMEGIFDLEGTKYRIYTIYPLPYGGQQQTAIKLINVKKGTWTIRLIGQYISNGIYNVYLPNKGLTKSIVKFSSNNPKYTINFPGGYRDMITVGTYDSINKSIWSESSRGPVIGVIGKMIKPDIVAPGVNIIAPYPGQNYCTITGSSVAASYVVGGVALVMQYTFSDRYYKSKGVVQKIRTFLRGGAKRSNQLVYPNEIYGYGVLDIKGAFDQLK